jgi:hypothetical protein
MSGLARSERELYLGARQSGMSVDLIDGPHSAEDAVVRAAKLHRHIFDRESDFVMVKIHALPDGSPSTNDDAADACRAAVERER